MPHNLAARCLKQKEDLKRDFMSLGEIFGLLLTPLVIPMFATLGRGTIVTGEGRGMLLGSN